LADVWLFDAAREWAPLATVGATATCAHGAAYLNGVFYVFGGVVPKGPNVGARGGVYALDLGRPPPLGCIFMLFCNNQKVFWLYEKILLSIHLLGATQSLIKI
jgi:hypothetical protein